MDIDAFQRSPPPIPLRSAVHRSRMGCRVTTHRPPDLRPSNPFRSGSPPPKGSPSPRRPFAEITPRITSTLHQRFRFPRGMTGRGSTFKRLPPQRSYPRARPGVSGRVEGPSFRLGFYGERGGLGIACSLMGGVQCRVVRWEGGGKCVPSIRYFQTARDATAATP